MHFSLPLAHLIKEITKLERSRSRAALQRLEGGGWGRLLPVESSDFMAVPKLRGSGCREELELMHSTPGGPSPQALWERRKTGRTGQTYTCDMSQHSNAHGQRAGDRLTLALEKH